MRPTLPRYYDGAPDDSYAALREAGTLNVLVAGDRVVLFHQHDGYCGVTGDDNLFVTAAQFDVDDDRTPTPGRRNTDRTFALTFGYRF